MRQKSFRQKYFQNENVTDVLKIYKTINQTCDINYSEIQQST